LEDYTDGLFTKISAGTQAQSESTTDDENLPHVDNHSRQHGARRIVLIKMYLDTDHDWNEIAHDSKTAHFYGHLHALLE
jgi:hypothetical protein